MSNYVHSTAIIGPDVKMGSNNFVGPYCVIQGNVTIGSNNRFEAFCSIGLPAEKHGYFDNEGPVKIGNENIFREGVTIHGGTTGITTVEDNVLMLRGSHAGHDVYIESNCTISCAVQIGGESHIMKFANIGLGAVIHQYQVIGSYCMIGMGSVVTKKCICAPGNVYVGSPAEYLKENSIGLHRAKVLREELILEVDRFRKLRCA